MRRSQADLLRLVLSGARQPVEVRPEMLPMWGASRNLGQGGCLSDFSPSLVSNFRLAEESGQKGDCGCGSTASSEDRPDERQNSPTHGVIASTARAQTVGRPRATRRSSAPAVPGAMPREKVDALFVNALDKVLATAKPLVVRGKASSTPLGMATRFDVGKRSLGPSPGGQLLDIGLAPIVLALIPEPSGIEIPDIVCSDDAWAETILETFIRASRFMYWATVILDLMNSQNWTNQACLWKDQCQGSENTQIEKWFGSFNQSRFNALRSRVGRCYRNRYQGDAPLTLYCSNSSLQGGVCASCDLGGGWYHGVARHICVCDSNIAKETVYMPHEAFHHITPGLLDHHICWEVPAPWKGDSVAYSKGLTGLLFELDYDDKWNAPAELLQGCPEQALRNCDSYAQWINHLGKAVDFGTIWPTNCTLEFPQSPGGGGDLDCSPDSLDGMCILFPPDDQGLPP